MHRQYLRDVRRFLPEKCPIICTSKGIETGSLALMQDILLDEMGTQRNYAFLRSSHCNTLQHTATHCNTLQHTATHCLS